MRSAGARRSSHKRGSRGRTAAHGTARGAWRCVGALGRRGTADAGVAQSDWGRARAGVRGRCRGRSAGWRWVLLCSLDNFVAESRDVKVRQQALRENDWKPYSSRFNAAQRTTHSTQSSFPSPSVCHTAFSSAVFPVMLILVPPPLGPGGFFWILPNSIRLGGMLCPA